MSKKKLLSLLSVILIIVVATAVYILNPFANKVKAGLQVITNQTSASLFLDGQYLDKAPYINKQILPGEYTLKIEPDDPELASYETPLTLTRGLLTVVTWNPGKTPETSGGVIYEMEPLNNNSSAQIAFVSLPDNALISFDGGEKQFTPLIIKDVEPGHHQFEISLPSFQTQQHTVNVIEGFSLNVSVKLARSQLALEETESESTINVATSSASLKAGDKVVEIQPTNYFEAEQEVLNVRVEPQADAELAGVAVVGEKYPYLEETRLGWYKIRLIDQTASPSAQPIEGWVSGDYSQLKTLE